MFASAATTLKVHLLNDTQLSPISIYRPKKAHSSQKITNLSWCHDNSYIALLQEESFPQIVSAKDRSTINLVHTIQALKNVTALKFKQNTKKTMALGNSEGEVILYDTKNRSVLSKICNRKTPIKAVEFNENDAQLAVATDKFLEIFSDYDGVNNFVSEVCYAEGCSLLKFHPSSRNVLALGSNDGSVIIRDTEKGDIITGFQKHAGPISGINFTERHKAIVTTGRDRKISIYDYNSSDCVFRMNIHQAITCSDVTLDDIYLAVGLEDGHVSVYDIRDPLKAMVSVHAHDSAVSKVIFERAVLLTEGVRGKMSGTTINGSELGDNRPVLLDLTKNNFDSEGALDEKFKQDMVRMVKNHMAYLESQLNDHCVKFQNFISHEFEAIHSAMSRWDVFNVGDSSEVAQAMGSGATPSAQSTTTKKTHIS